MVNCISNIPCIDERISQGFKAIERALAAAHRTAIVSGQTRGIRTALNSSDYELCFRTAQDTLKRCRKMIASYALVTGVHLVWVTEEEARSWGIDCWKAALRFVEMLIYANEAVKAGLESIIKKELQKIFSPEDGNQVPQ